ncbi:hypothetical protein M404DRAFT_32348 [Pisolithus tinctorius Marx 270]|uniref:Uncharacterized protein n=1 Tax=Pisolithus tinctorius Marx 270 TaxID=870435 RepID=A0A0C3N8J7_PISTI|nr:hypothetical protein M404DRAFT_32348 [Pisolithus tinctorius Marx 270]
MKFIFASARANIHLLSESGLSAHQISSTTEHPYCHDRAFIISPYTLRTLLRRLFTHSAPTLPNICCLRTISAPTAVRLVLLSYRTEQSVL